MKMDADPDQARRLKHPRKLVERGVQPAVPAGMRSRCLPDATKGGKMTGETQCLYAATLRTSRMLEARRFQLQSRRAAYIFGSEVGGYYIASFDKSWRALFTLAGLDWGRAKGLTWHTTRHEFISRVAETTKNPKDAQEAARHKRLETTQRYMHYAAGPANGRMAHGLNR